VYVYGKCSLFLREEHKVQLLADGVLKKISEHKRDDDSGGWRT
jgi:hypothetical protein